MNELSLKFQDDYLIKLDWFASTQLIYRDDNCFAILDYWMIHSIRDAEIVDQLPPLPSNREDGWFHTS